jgi:hypothetical protein
MPGEKMAAEMGGRIAKGAAFVGVGAAVAVFAMRGCGGDGEGAHSQAEAEEVAYAAPGMLDTEIGDVVVNVSMDHSVTRGFQRCAPIAGCVGIHKTNEIEVQGSGENSYTVDFPQVGIRTTRGDENNDGIPDGRPRPDDEVTVVVDPSSLRIESNFNVEDTEDRTLNVRDGMVVEQDGRELEEDDQWPIFREDGPVELWGYQQSEGRDGWTRFVEGLTHNTVQIGNNQRSEASAAAAIIASDPQCDTAARERMDGGLTSLTQAAARRAFAEQGYNPDNVQVELEAGEEWPDPENTENSDGLTFDDRVEIFEEHLGTLVHESSGEAVSLDVAAECTADGVEDTTSRLSTSE